MQSQSNEEVLAIAEKHPGRFIPFCNIDPRNYRNDFTSPFADGLKWYRDKGCKGLGELCCNLSILDGRVQALFKAAEEVGFPVTFHMAPFTGNNYGLVDLPGMPGLEMSMQRFPNLKLFGHSQAFWCEIGKYRGQHVRFGYPKGTVDEGRIPQLMRKYPNLYGDLSAGSGYNALARDRAYAAKFLTEFQDRVLFGMDICSPQGERGYHNPLAEFLKDMLAKGEISETVFRKVARENAIRLLGV
jgi:predicted TIM-barrel fold metal-dependent hydrolase